MIDVKNGFVTSLGNSTPAIQTGLFANRPVSGTVLIGTLYVSTDTKQIFSNTSLGWVDVTIGSNGIPAGGSRGQALVKVDGDDYNVTWSSSLRDVADKISVDYQNRALYNTSGGISVNYEYFRFVDHGAISIIDNAIQTGMVGQSMYLNAIIGGVPVKILLG